MRTVSALAFVGLMIFSPLGMTQSIFNGTWRPDPQRPNPTQKTDLFVLTGGTYNCKSCTPPYDVKADGLDQSIAGNPRYNTISVKIVDDRTLIKAAKKEGKTVAETTVVISADGNTMTETRTISGILPRPVEMASPKCAISVSGGASRRL